MCVGVEGEVPCTGGGGVPVWWIRGNGHMDPYLWTDRHHWQHYLPATSLAAGNTYQAPGLNIRSGKNAAELSIPEKHDCLATAENCKYKGPFTRCHNVNFYRMAMFSQASLSTGWGGGGLGPLLDIRIGDYPLPPQIIAGDTHPLQVTSGGDH